MALVRGVGASPVGDAAAAGSEGAPGTGRAETKNRRPTRGDSRVFPEFDFEPAALLEFFLVPKQLVNLCQFL